VKIPRMESTFANALLDSWERIAKWIKDHAKKTTRVSMMESANLLSTKRNTIVIAKLAIRESTANTIRGLASRPIPVKMRGLAKFGMESIMFAHVNQGFAANIARKTFAYQIPVCTEEPVRAKDARSLVIVNRDLREIGAKQL